jgi:hypothetical protein
MSINVSERDLVGTLRRTIGWLVLLGCGAVLGLCLFVAIEDESSHSDELDGLGAFIAALVGVPAVIGLVLVGVALLLESRRPVVARVLTGFVSVAVALLGVAVALSFSLWGVLLVLVGLLHGLTAMVPAEHHDSAT